MPTATAHYPNARRTDPELLHGVRAGDVECFADLYRRHQQMAVRVALRAGATRYDVDDVVAEAFAKVLRAVRGGHGPTENFVGYLALAVKRVAWSSQIDSGRYRPTDDLTLLDGAANGVGHESVAGSRAAEALAALPRADRSLLWRTEVDGDQVGEIARDLGKTSNSVSAAACRARSRLRTEYARRVAS